MPETNWPLLLIGVSFVFGAVALVGLGQIATLLRYRLHGRRVVGRVARVNRHDDGDGPSYTCDVKYEADRRQFEVSPSYSSSPALYRKGEFVPVYYLSEHPDKGRIVTLRELAVWLFFVLCGLGVITWIAIAAAMA